MKRFQMYFPRFYALIILTFFLIAGCTHSFNSSKIEKLKTGSPLNSINSRNFSINEFKDTRDIDPLLFGKWSGYEFKLDKSVASVVTQSIKNEFIRNGHTFLTTKQQSRADFNIEGTIYRYMMRLDKGAFTSKVTAEVAMKMTVIDNIDKNRIYVKNYEGESIVEGIAPLNAITGPSPLDIIGQAQLSMLKDMSTDSKLIDFLKNSP